jgi:hypothetical protein
MSAIFFYKSGEADANGYVEGPRQKRYRQDNGWQIGRSFRGPSTNEAAFLTTVSPNVQDVDISYEGPVSVVSIWYADATGNAEGEPATLAPKDPMFTGWSLTGNTVVRSLLTHPDYSTIEPTAFAPYSLGQVAVGDIIKMVKTYKRELEQGVESDALATLDTYVEANISANAIQDPYFEGVSPDTSEQRLARRRWLFKELANGDDEWEFDQPVLRKVSVLRSSSETKASFTNCKRAFTWSALKSAEPTLDVALLIGIETLEAMNGNEVWLWQKRFPTLDIGSDGKRTLTQEYWGWQGFDVVRYGAIIT